VDKQTDKPTRLNALSMPAAVLALVTKAEISLTTVVEMKLIFQTTTMTAPFY